MSLDDVKIRDEYAAAGWLSKRMLGDLAIYNYTLKTVHEKKWDEVTLNSRGHILNTVTGEWVARPFPKFFNLNQTPETQMEALPLHEKYTVVEKMDGSLGVLYRIDGKLRIATRGSFDSDQAVKATEMLHTLYHDLDKIDGDVTLCFEIIYPENRIIVNYRNMEGLVLLAAFNRHTGEEISGSKYRDYANGCGFFLPVLSFKTLDFIVQEAAGWSCDMEGFVIRFSSGLRVKVKGQEYLQIARLLSGLSVHRLWESMRDGKVPDSILGALPESLRERFAPVKRELETGYSTISNSALIDFCATVRKMIDRKAFADEAKKSPHASALFSLLDGKGVERYVMKAIEPKERSIDATNDEEQ